MENNNQLAALTGQRDPHGITFLVEAALTQARLAKNQHLVIAAHAEKRVDSERVWSVLKSMEGRIDAVIEMLTEIKRKVD